MKDNLTNKDLFRSMFRISLESVLVANEDGSIVMANPACEDLFGYTSEILIGKNIEILIPQKFKQQLKKHIKTYNKNPKARTVSTDINLWGIKKDLTQFPLEISLSPTKIEGKPVIIIFVADFTQRKANKEALAVSEHRMTEAQRLSHIGSWYWNIKTNERYWSDEFYRIYNLPLKDERLSAETAIEFIHPDDRESATEALNAAIDNHTPYSHKNRILRPDGTSRYVLGKGRVSYDEKGNPLEMVGTMQDITEQKELRESLSESNRKISTLIGNLNGIAYRCKNNRDWTMEYISEGCEKITGYSREAFLEGKVHFSHITFKEDQEQIWNTTQEGINKQISFSLNYRIRDNKGAVKYLQELGRGIYDKSGKLEALEGFIRDVTAQKETKTELIDSEDQTRALLEANPDMMFIQNRKGDYLEFHGNSAEKFFIPPKKFIGVNMKKVLPPNVYKKIKSSHTKVLATGKMQIAGYSVQGKEGMEHYEARVVLLNDHKLLTIVRDVTKEKAKDALLNIRNNALASASNSIIIAEAQQPNTPIIYCNKAFEKNTGYTLEETCGRNCNFLQDNDRDQQEIDIIKNAILNGEACNVVLRNYKKDGTLFWNDVTIAPVHNENHKLTHFIGVQNDVTDKIKQERLKNQTREILELIAQDTSLKTISHKIIETVESHFEYCVASILIVDKNSKTLHKLAAPNLPKEYAEFLKNVTIGSKVCSSGTAAFLKKKVIVSNIENNSLWEDYKDVALKSGLKACWAFPIMSSTNQVLGTFAIYSLHTRKPSNEEKEIAVDMSYLASIAIENHNNSIRLLENNRELEKHAQKLEKKVANRTNQLEDMVQKLTESNLTLADQIQETKEAERKALANQTLFRVIAKKFPNGVIAVVDAEYKISYIEGEELAEFRVKGIDFEGVCIDKISLLSKGQKNSIKESIRRTLDGANLSFEIEFNNQIYSVHTLPLGIANDGLEQALFVYNNISLQKEIEFKTINALAKEKELGELKSNFISMASHEFRTPLSTILSSANLIARQNDTGKEDQRIRYVGSIRTSVKNLVVILNDFLSLSKLEEGKIKAQPTVLDFVDFSKSVIKEIKGIKKKGQIIEFIHNQSEIYMFHDSKLLRHIIHNLLSNAIKYSGENKKIIYKVDGSDNQLRIEVIDQGIGIPNEEQKKMFQRFYRAKNTVNIQGTGLGLNIVKQYTELMGGVISFNSKLHEGSTFIVELPLNLNN